MSSLPRPGDRLAGFRLERELGRGVTGTVFLAHQEALGRDVALKVVGRPLAADDAFRERFRREARTAAGLDHPNVVQILEAGEDDAHLWLAMRLVDGPDLRVLLRRTERLEPAQAVAVVEQVAAALDAAHAAGLVHRDVKPGNVLIEDGPGRDLHVELADFGLARAPGVEEPDGTPGYAAPEQLAGGDVGPAADVFGLGCVLFELLTGTAPPAPSVVPTGVPWRQGPEGGDGGAPPARVHGAALPLRPSTARPRLGGAFDAAVQRATAEDPADRFASAGELAMWARAALTVPALPAVDDPAGSVRPAVAGPATGAEVVAGAATWELARTRPVRRSGWGRRVAVGTFLVVVLVLLGVAFAVVGPDDDADDRLLGLATTAPGAATGIGGGVSGTSGSAPSTGGAAPGGSAGGPGAVGRGGTSSAGAGAAGSGGTTGGGSGRERGTADRAGGGATSGSAAGTAAGRDGSGAAAGRGGSGAAQPSTGRGAPGAGTISPGRGAGAGTASSGTPGARATSPAGGTGSGVPLAGPRAPRGAGTPPLPPIPAGATRFGGGTWILDLPTAEGWRQTAVQELDGGARVVTRLQRADRVRLLLEALPGRTAVTAIAGARTFPVRLPDAGRTDGALYRGGRYAMCADGGVCAALPANGPSGGVVLIAGAHRAAGAKRIARRAAAGLRVR